MATSNGHALAVALDAYAAQLRTERHASPHTLRAYTADVRAFFADLDMPPPARVTAADVRHWLRGLDGRPDIDSGSCNTVELEQEVFAQQLLVGPPLCNDVARLFRNLLAAPALGRIELDQFENHVFSPS